MTRDSSEMHGLCLTLIFLFQLLSFFSCFEIYHIFFLQANGFPGGRKSENRNISIRHINREMKAVAVFIQRTVTDSFFVCGA